MGYPLYGIYVRRPNVNTAILEPLNNGYLLPIIYYIGIKLECREYEKFKYLKFSKQKFEKSTFRVRRSPDLQMRF